jgi:hypothetical protein
LSNRFTSKNPTTPQGKRGRLRKTERKKERKKDRKYIYAPAGDRIPINPPAARHLTELTWVRKYKRKMPLHIKLTGTAETPSTSIRDVLISSYPTDFSRGFTGPGLTPKR